jgi:Domain of unknown function (DUF4129)
MQVNSSPGEPQSRLGRRARLVLVLVALSAAVALGAGAGGLVGKGRSDSPVLAEAAKRAAIGACIGLLLGVLAVILLQYLAREHSGLHRMLYAGKEASSKTAFRRAVPLLLLLTGIAALIGASLAPSRSDSSNGASSSSTAKQRPQPGDARYVDRNGTRELQVDRDGDGRYETVYRLCPGSEWPNTGTTVAPEAGDSPTSVANQPDGTVRMPLDYECDGHIDDYVNLRIRDIPTTPPRPGVTSAPRAPTTTPTTTSPKPSVPTVGSALGKIILFVLALAVIVAIVLGIARRKPKPDVTDKPVPEEDEAVAVVAASVARSSDELAVDNDPRRAIIAAYGRLLEGLAAAGLPRLPEEAPEEYLGRCLARVAVDHAPFHELTRLFNLARFSRHDITEEHRRAASAELDRAGQSLPHVRAGAPA